MTALYSVNLRVMQRPNIAIIDEQTVFTSVNAEIFGLDPAGNEVVVLLSLCVVLLLVFLLARFFVSEFGLAIRAIGINPKVSRAYGIRVGKMKIIALMLSNGIVALSGALFAQSQGFADISMGGGTIIIGLASVIIGEAVLFRPKRIIYALLACALGSIIYRVAIAFALNANSIGLEVYDLNLITAAIVAITMIIPKLKKA